MAFDETLATRVRRILDPRADLVEKHMFGGVCFMIRGRMVCGIIDSSLMVRLDPADADRIVDQPHVRPMDFTGKPMRGYLFVEAEAVATPKALKAWVDRCVTHIETMPVKRPRPARKKAVTRRSPRAV
ncbi:MAG TPA: TfoX/Sxy family protein [Vicinamibacterales bacterium]|nr:TfoX/Sxy family protein [Vicinamibacterales bacterium]